MPRNAPEWCGCSIFTDVVHLIVTQGMPGEALAETQESVPAHGRGHREDPEGPEHRQLSACVKAEHCRYYYTFFQGNNFKHSSDTVITIREHGTWPSSYLMETCWREVHWQLQLWLQRARGDETRFSYFKDCRLQSVTNSCLWRDSRFFGSWDSCVLFNPTPTPSSFYVMPVLIVFLLNFILSCPDQIYLPFMIS